MVRTILPIFHPSILLIAVLVLALGLRLYRIDASSLWNDEGTSVAVAQRSLATIGRDAANDIHPPLYYWLLHGWVKLAGTSEAGVRSLSALLGVALVALVYALGRLLAGHRAALVAAFLAAISPFQVYYSQEARMYMLLAALGALSFYAALRWAAAGNEAGRRVRWTWAGLYVLAAAAGLYTHYAFPMILAAANLAVLLDIALRWRAASGAGRLWRWIVLQLAALLLFAPWLPTAYQQLISWPRVAGPLQAQVALAQTWQVLVFGPLGVHTDSRGWGWTVLFLLFFVPQPRRRPLRPGDRLPDLVTQLAPALWLGVPVAAMLALGLFKEAYVKFLLAISPAFCLALGRLLANPPRPALSARWQRTAYAGLAAVAIVVFTISSTTGLAGYFRHPAGVRDDYRGIAAYIQAVERPSDDSIILDAPGQQEVFGYYYHGGSKVYALPASRPPDPAATEAALSGLIHFPGRVFAVFWATDESDPQRIVEDWLDSHAYKAVDLWYGNVRLAVYATMPAWSQPKQETQVVLGSAATGDQIDLLGYTLWPTGLPPGDVARITLFWRPKQTPVRRYKVFIHVLDEANNIVGQTDTEPGGGARLTTTWSPGQTVIDNYGVLIHPATPPGSYRVEVGLYDMETGERLVGSDGATQVWLESLKVIRPGVPAPAAALGMQSRANVAFSDFILLGYDYYKLGYDRQPDTPLRPGDVLHVNLYWQAREKPAGDWRLAVDLVRAGGRELVGVDAEPVPGYATGQWEPGDVWRGQFNLRLPDHDIAPPGRYRLRIQAISPDGRRPEPYLTGAVTIR